MPDILTRNLRPDPARSAARATSHNLYRARSLAHLKQGTTDLDSATMPLDPAVYTDPEIYEREMRVLFGELPLFAGLTLDIPEPGNMLVFDALGPSILVVRAKDGGVNAFLNMCTHRAAKLVTECSRKTRMTCRFHGWTFDLDGRLIGLPGKEGFEGLDRSERGLIRVPVAEKYGLILVHLDPDGGPIDVDAYLGDFVDQIAHLELDKARPVRSTSLQAKANWKYCLDTFGESYHFATLHPQTIGDLAPSNILAYDNFGLHSHLAVPRKEYYSYADQDEADWPPTNYGGVYGIFPNVVINVNSIVGIGPFYGITRVFPDGAVDRTRSFMTTYQPAHAGEDIDLQKWIDIHDFNDHVVLTEDYSVSADGQQNLKYAPAGFQPVLGRNEIAVQHWHRNYAALMAGRN